MPAVDKRRADEMAVVAAKRSRSDLVGVNNKDKALVSTAVSIIDSSLNVMFYTSQLMSILLYCVGYYLLRYISKFSSLGYVCFENT